METMKEIPDHLMEIINEDIDDWPQPKPGSDGLPDDVTDEEWDALGVALGEWAESRVGSDAPFTLPGETAPEWDPEYDTVLVRLFREIRYGVG